jgi:cytochrome c peroxidase
MWGRQFTVVVITLALFGETAFFARHARAQNSPPATLQTEIAQVEARVDALEGAALTQTSQVYPGAPEAVAVLGKVLFFDKDLSVNRNTACGFCHIPETGFQGGIELINRTIVNQPGSVRTRFSLRKPPSAAYAA